MVILFIDFLVDRILSTIVCIIIYIIIKNLTIFFRTAPIFLLLTRSTIGPQAL